MSNAEGQQTSAPPTNPHLDMFSAVAACLSGLAATFNNSFRVFAYVLAAINGVLLLVVALMRINAGLANKKHRLPLAVSIACLCAVSLGLAGWSIAHPKPADKVTAKPNTLAQPAAVPSQPVVYTNSTSGSNSPIQTGQNSNYTSMSIQNEQAGHRRK